mgnify:CR=1 FL=1
MLHSLPVARRITSAICRHTPPRIPPVGSWAWQRAVSIGAAVGRCAPQQLRVLRADLES